MFVSICDKIRKEVVETENESILSPFSMEVSKVFQNVFHIVAFVYVR